MRIHSRDGVELALHDLGGDGPTLLVAHATGFLGAVYRPFARALHDRFHVWALDFRGHGDAGKSADLSWDRMAEDVLAAVSALPARPYGFGHSMGGAALVLAEQAAPGTFSALYLYEPVVVPVGTFPETSGDNPMSAAARRRRPSFPDRQAAYDNYTSKPPLDVLHPDALRAYVDEGFADDADGSVSLKCRPGDEAAVFAGGGRHGAFDRLGSLALPVVVAQGGVADPGPGALASAQAAAVPGARLVVADGLGHFGPVQDPAAVAASVVAELLDR